MTRIAPRLLGFLLLSGLATSPALAQMYNAGDACPEPTPGRVFTQEGAAGPALVCNGTTLEVYESVLTGPLRKGIGTATPQATLDISSTDSVLLPRGTTAQRPGTPVNGMIRYNSTNNKFEAYENGAWTNVIGGGTASAAGSTEEIQFNSGGNLAATSDFYWDTTNKYLTLDSGAANLDSTLAFANAGTRQWLLANRGSNSSPANSLLFYNHGTVNSGYVTMALTQNGDVGIGTTSPGALTHINTTDTTGNSILEALRLSHEDTDSAAANGNGAALTFNLETATNNTFREAARIAGVWDDAANGSKDGSLRFYTMGPNAASGTTTTTERMRIDSSGFVGIGTATPGARLNVVDNSGGGTIWVQDTGASGFSEIGLRDSDGTAAAYISHDNAADKLEIYTAGARPIVFMPNGTERIRISQTGAMGIGTASPAATLHVNGEAIIGNTSLACSGTTEGAQRYNSTSHVMEYCNGTSWVGFGSGVTSNCPTSDVTSGLVARWKFDESSGTSAADSSGNGLTGTLTNGPVWQPNNGYLNGALFFDGLNDYVSVSDPGTGSVLDFGNGSSLTLTAWVMADVSNHDGADLKILVKGMTTGTDDPNYNFYIAPGYTEKLSNTLAFCFDNPVGTYHCFMGPTVPNMAFVAFSFTFGTANSARFYINGDEFPGLAIYGSPNTTAPLVNNLPLWIGASNGAMGGAGAPEDIFRGQLDDVRIYNRKLTKQEIRDVYNFTSRACN